MIQARLAQFCKTGLIYSVVASLLMVLAAPLVVQAAATNVAPTAKISFTFDEGYDSTYSQAAPTLAQYGMTGTVYVTTGCVGMTQVPNTCHANTDAKYITWDQIAQLKNKYNWEIGSHTVSHPYLASSDASDGQPNRLTPAQITEELQASKAALAARGYDARSFATPYGDYDMPVLAEIAKYYETHRGFADTGYNRWPNNEYLMRVQQVQGGVSVAQVKGYIDQAAANGEWLILVFHNIKTRPSNDPDDYEYSTSNLGQIAAYAKAKGVPSVNPSSAITRSDENLLPNGSFNEGITGGWTTDTPANVVRDSGTNGSYPDPLHAIKFTSAAGKNVHLFSPRVAVDSNATYMMKSFINVRTVSSGEFGFYIDEYDANGNWISGQWKGAERSVFLENYNFTYKPTSRAVTTASLQIYATGNAGITAYLDNVQWFPLTAAEPSTQTSLVANSTFDEGIAAGWSTDSGSSVVADNSNNGHSNNQLHSVKMISNNNNVHLFSPYVDVDASKTYDFTVYAKIVQRSGGELGYYIDEYDANGNWISGQWKGARYTVSTGDSVFSYKPTSANVKQASLQIYVTGNASITAYVDYIRWMAAQ